MSEETEPKKPAPQGPAPTFRVPRQVSRPKPIVEQQEELGPDPRIGNDFADAYALSVSEAKMVVDTVHKARREKDSYRNVLGADRVHNDSE